MSATKPASPRLNHVAMSMPADALDDEGRAAITKFYGDVFGWMEYDMLTQDRRRLVMRVHSDEQFVFLDRRRLADGRARAWITSACRSARSTSSSRSTSW